jgi:hypothetical protein
VPAVKVDESASAGYFDLFESLDYSAGFQQILNRI